jgi:NAD-dependent DNA ligase
MGVRLSGVDITFLTGHNAKFIHDNKIGPGAVIKISRRGDVIPYIEDVIKPASKWGAPAGKEGIDWQWNESGVDIYQTEDHSDQDTAKVRALTHFFATLDVDGLRGGTIQRLYDAGFDDVKKILTAKPKEWVELLGPKVAQTLSTNLRTIFVDHQLWLPDVMYATGIFGRGVGSKTLWKLWEHFGNGLATKKYSLATLRSALSGDVAVSAIAEKLPVFQAWLKQFPKWKFAEAEEAEVQSTKLEGVAVCMTGFRDADLAADIEANSGTVVDGVSKNTTHLLVKDPSTTSSKAEKARSLGIPVLTPLQFRKQFKL